MNATVLLIHGTGAMLPDDQGSAWWQRGSSFVTELDGGLAGHAQCAQDRPLFRWSGANSERARRQAAHHLLENWLLRFEREGCRYHLIGHSHGGSVIWEALVEATRRGHRLERLVSWSTVGTPFLHYTVRRADWLFLLPLVVVTMLWSSLPAQAFVVWQHTREMYADGNWRTAAALLMILVLATGLWLFLLSRVVSVVRGLWRLPKRRAAERAAAAAYGSKWLGIWANDDEAINGLKNTIGFEANLTPRAAARTSAGWPLFLLRLPLSIAGWAYNYSIARTVDAFISERIARRLQGNDRTSDVLRAVTTSPLADRAGDPLPEDASHKLTSRADQHAAETLRKIRQVLGSAAIDDSSSSPQVIGRLAAHLSYQELVHTSYFDLPEIQALLASHIASATAEQTVTPSAHKAPRTGPVLSTWHGLRGSFVLTTAFLLGGFLISASAGGLFLTAYDYTDEANILALISDAPMRALADDAFAADDEKREAVRDWIRTLIGLGRLDAAVEGAVALSDADLRDWAHLWIAAELAHEGRLDEAAEALPDDFTTHWFDDVVYEFINGKELEVALFLAGHANLDDRPRITHEVAVGFAKSGDAKRALELESELGEATSGFAGYQALTATLIEAKQLESALVAARQVPLHSRAKALASVAIALQAAGRIDLVKDVAQDAIAAAVEVESAARNLNPGSSLGDLVGQLAAGGLIEYAFPASDRIPDVPITEVLPDRRQFASVQFQSALNTIAKEAASRGLIPETLRATGKLEKKSDADYAEFHLVERLAELNRLDDARKVAATITDAYYKSAAFQKIGEVLAKEDRVDEAIQALANVPKLFDQSHWLSLMAEEAHKSGKPEVANALIDRSLSVARTDTVEGSYFVLAEDAALLVQLGRPDAKEAAVDAADAARRHESSPSPNLTLLAPSVTRLIEAGFISEARSIAEGMPLGATRNTALRQVAKVFAEAGHEDEARAVLSKVVADRFDLPEIDVAPIPPFIPPGERVRDYAKSPREALEALRKISTSQERDHALETTAHDFAEDGDAVGARDCLSLIEDRETHDRIAVELVSLWIEAGRIADAVDVAVLIKDVTTRVGEQLKAFAARPDAVDAKALQALRGDIETIAEVVRRSRAFGELAKIHAERGELRRARVIAASCYANERLSVHTIILKKYAQRR